MFIWARLSTWNTPQRVAAAQHLVDAGLLLRDRRQLPPFAVVPFDQIEAFADAGQHAEREHVDLEDPEFVDVVLVPFDEGAVVHRAVADRHRLGQRPLGQDEAADMLRQMRGMPIICSASLIGPLQLRPVAQVQPGIAWLAPPDHLAHPSAPRWSSERRRNISLRPITLQTSRIAERGR
jgi:hypothetical protein